MKISVIFLSFASFVLIGEFTTAVAEYCKKYPGDIAFSYSTTQDEYSWFQNYQNAYATKKGGTPYTIYRRRTIITRRPRPRGAHPSFYNNMNANVNDIQVQQVQQQQVQGPFPFVEANPEEQSMNETEEEPKEEPLPIWKLTIPRQCSRAVIARIENAQVVEHFELNSTHFQNPNLTTTSSSSSIPTISITSSQSSRTIDVTDQSIIPDAWYAVCIDVNVVEKGKPQKCNHCTLIKARTDTGRQTFLDFDWVPTSFQNTSAEVRFSAADFPFPWATIRSKVWTKYALPRCQNEGEKVVFESKDFAYPEHFTFLEVQNLIGKMSYAIQVDLEFPWKQEAEEILPKPFTLYDYLHSDTTSSTLAKCEDYNYNGN